MNLSPHKPDATLFDGEGGGYYAWTAANFPLLATAKLGAGKLVLQPGGFAFPHYADASKIGYVTQGKCMVGLVSPNSPKEEVVVIEEGDTIPVYMGDISWWYNTGDSDTTVVFLGESGQSYNPGLFDYFFLTGAIGALHGFSTDFVAKIYSLTQPDAEELVNSQPKPLLVRLGEDVQIPRQCNCNVKDHVANLRERGEITGENFPLLDRIGLSALLVRAKAGCAVQPSYSAGATYRIIYVVKGGGRVQIAGLNGTQALDAVLQEDQLFVVPHFFAVAVVAGETGIELFCVSTSARPVRGQLGGPESAWKALSTPVLQASLNVSPEFVKLFKQKIEESNNCN